MKIIKNENLIKRNGRIGQWTSLGALGVLGIGMYLSFQPARFVCLFHRGFDRWLYYDASWHVLFKPLGPQSAT